MSLLVHAVRNSLTNTESYVWNSQIDNLPAPFDEVAMTPTTLCVLVNGSIFALPVDGSEYLQPTGKHDSLCGLRLLGLPVNKDCG